MKQRRFAMKTVNISLVMPRLWWQGRAVCGEEGGAGGGSGGGSSGCGGSVGGGVPVLYTALRDR